MRDITVDALESFKVDGLPGLAPGSKKTVLAKVRCFLRAAFRRSWLTEALAEKLTTYQCAREQTKPYTDAEVEAILKAIEGYVPSAGNGRKRAYIGNPARFRLLIELMLAAGMRVGDAGTLHHPRLFNPAFRDRYQTRLVFGRALQFRCMSGHYPNILIRKCIIAIKH